MNGEPSICRLAREGGSPRAAGSTLFGPERTCMPHFLAARPRAVAEQGRLIASLVGVLALLVGMFAMAAAAGAATSKPRANAAGHHAEKHHGDKAKDDAKAKDDDKADHDDDAGDENQPPACDSSGEGNPC